MGPKIGWTHHRTSGWPQFIYLDPRTTGTKWWRRNGDGAGKSGPACQRKKASHAAVRKKHHLFITCVCVFVCLKGEGHKDDKDGEEWRRVERDGFNVTITVVRWQLGCDGTIVQSCLYKVGQKHMTCTSDSQRTPWITKTTWQQTSTTLTATTTHWNPI